MERNIKIKVSYDGTDLCGWQVQDNGRTVQGEMEKALEKIHGKRIRLTGSGRTDSGVHANGQTANFFTEKDIPAHKFVPALNSMLPADIRVMESVEAVKSFHSRFDAKVRIYKYYIKPGGICEPKYARYCWRINRMPEVRRLNRIVAPIVGIHDYSTFTASGDPSNSRVRQVFSAAFEIEKQFIVFKIAGNAFLWKMVRSILGTVIGLEEKGADHDDMKMILESMNRSAAGATAPAKGLFLDRVLYDEREFI